MTTHFEYKGYIGSIEPDPESGLLHGEALGLRDGITYHAETLPQLEKEFHTSVDEYLRVCELNGRTPDRPYSGQFVLRVGEDLHRKAVGVADARQISLNQFATQAIENEIGRPASG
ncbi:MAG: type II toxin-antitoxin system HicB family antitoxin [Planctomycetota bacterium]